MLWFIIIYIGVILFATWYYMGSDRESLWLFFVPLGGGLMMGTFIAGIFCLIGDMVFEDRVDYIEEHALIAVSDGSSTTGRFFLGSGTLNSTPHFTYYKKTGNHYTLEAEPAVLSTVVFTDGVPKVVTKHMDGGNFWLAPWANNPERYEFHVPEGSIVQNFELDAR